MNLRHVLIAALLGAASALSAGCKPADGPTTPNTPPASSPSP